MAEQATPQSDIFHQLDQYPWDSDHEFQTGLHAILESNASQEQAEYLTLRAKCFYYSRKNNVTLDFDAYRDWRAHAHRLQVHSDPFTQEQPAQSLAASNPPDNPIFPIGGNALTGAIPRPGDQPAPYPVYFNQIVDLITSGQPIPGIKEVPDTVLEGQESRPSIAKRKKPWEKSDDKAHSVSANT